MSDSNLRRGRPKGSGLNDRQVLMAIAANIASDNTLKPTTAIRAMGLSDPSVIRRLRDKYKIMEGELRAAHKAEPAGENAQSGLASERSAKAKLDLEDSTNAADGFRPTPAAGDQQNHRPADRRTSGILLTRDLDGKSHSSGIYTIAAAAPRAPVIRETPRHEVSASTASRSGAEKSPSPAAAQAGTAPAGIGPRVFEPLSPASEWLASWYGMGIGVCSTAFEAQLALMQQLLTLPPVAMAIGNQVAINKFALSLYPAKPAQRAVVH